MQIRALLDSGSAVSFISERVAQSLCLCRFSQNFQICRVIGVLLEDSRHSLSSFKIAPVHNPKWQLTANAVVVPRVTCELPTKHVPLNQEWEHVKGLILADPDFGKPGKVDLLLGVETFVDIIISPWPAEGTSMFSHCHRDLLWLGLGWQHQHPRCCSSSVLSCICTYRR